MSVCVHYQIGFNQLKSYVDSNSGMFGQLYVNQRLQSTTQHREYSIKPLLFVNKIR